MLEEPLELLQPQLAIRRRRLADRRVRKDIEARAGLKPQRRLALELVFRMSAGNPDKVAGALPAASASRGHGAAAASKQQQQQPQQRKRSGLKGVDKQESRKEKFDKLRRNLKLRGSTLNKLRRGLEDAKAHPRAVVGALELVEEVLDFAQAVEHQRLENEKLERRFARLQEEVVISRRRAAATTIPPVLILGAQRANERFWHPRE